MRRKEKLSKYKMNEIEKYEKRIEQLNVLKSLVGKYGNKQITICIEEMSELTKALCKYLRNCDFDLDKMIAIDDIYEEMADVYIMLNQMQILFQMDNEILDAMIDKKIQRTKERLLDN
jgi:AAA15 family ATPase/GTPase